MYLSDVTNIKKYAQNMINIFLIEKKLNNIYSNILFII